MRGIFMGMAIMYAGMYPAFKDVMLEMIESGLTEGFNFFRGFEDISKRL